MIAPLARVGSPPQSADFPGAMAATELREKLDGCVVSINTNLTCSCLRFNVVGNIVSQY